MTIPRVYTYVCTDPDCPEQFRAVAHCFAPVVIPRKGTRLGLLPATQMAATPDDAEKALTAFLLKEIAREIARKDDRLRRNRAGCKNAGPSPAKPPTKPGEGKRMSEPVRLHTVGAPVLPVDDDLIAGLEALLELARTGSIQGFVYATIKSTGVGQYVAERHRLARRWRGQQRSRRPGLA